MSERSSLRHRLLREPLVHFLLLGGGIFLAFGLLRGSGVGPRERIVVSSSQVEQLVEGFRRTWQRHPTRQELDGLIQDHILEEIYYREALALGLDQDDTIVRRRLRQKLEFLAEEVDESREPTEEELEAFRIENAERFRVGASLSFDHVYLSADRRGESIAKDAERLREALARTPSDLAFAGFGDPFLLPHTFEEIPADELDRMFGAGFAERVLALERGSWRGPVESAYGLHLVRLRAARDGSLPPLEEIRDAVRTEWEATRRRTMKEEYERRLRQGYRVTIELPERLREGPAP